jgi:hypothetical protein
MEDEMKKGVCSGWLENLTLPFTDLTVKMNNMRVSGSWEKIKVNFTCNEIKFIILRRGVGDLVC